MFEVKKLDGGRIVLEQDALDTLAASLRGDVLFPGGSDYDSARTI